MFKDLLKPNRRLEADRQARLAETARLQAQRAADPMLDYWNADITWVVCDVNMGPGGELFTGIEVHARWARPEEPMPYDAEQYRRYVTVTPPCKYSAWQYRIVAVGLLPEAARRIVALRNQEVLHGDGRPWADVK